MGRDRGRRRSGRVGRGGPASQAGARVLSSRPTDPAAGPAPSSVRASPSTWARTRSTPPVRGGKVLRSLGITPRGARPPLHRYRASTGGVQHVLPTGPGSLLRTGAVGPRSKAQLAGLLVRVPRIKPETLARTSVAEWLASCRLRPDAEAVLRALIRLGTYTADVDGLQRRCRRLPVAGSGERRGALPRTAGGASSSKHWVRGLDVRTGTEVTGVDRVGHRVEVRTGEGALVADQVVVATGGPAAVRRLLPADPGWGDLGPPADRGVPRPRGDTGSPTPATCCPSTIPLYATVQSPPARQAPDGPGRGGRHPLRGPRAPTRTAPGSNNWWPRPGWSRAT